MFEYHGWITFVYTPYDVENEIQKLRKVVNYIKNLLEQTLPTHHIAKLEPINGQYMASFAGFANHRSSLEDNLIHIYQEVAQKATGSYGILYVWNDEDIDFDNEFRVGRLARGKFEFLDDPFLSPRIPTLEDPYS